MAHDFTSPPSIISPENHFPNLIRTPIPNFLEPNPNTDHLFQFNDIHHHLNPSHTLHNIHPMINPEFPGFSENTFPGLIMSRPGEHIPGLDSHNTPEMGNGMRDSRKRKVPDGSESSSGVSSHSPHPSGRGTKRKIDSGRAKRMKKRGRLEEEEEEEEKPKDVVHVRARRGQATDSHSLAERVRRGKINERLKCLQDIVPGCYKTMGLAVMLDEIINYVQSLQNQVEFLSMKLTAASSYYDFNSESDAIDKMQRAMAVEAKELQRIAREGSNGGGSQANNFQSISWNP